jgi:lipoate-protein ligase A
MNRKLDELVHRSAAKAAGVTVIKRFSGGGTVAVDSDTVFATLISSEAAIPEVGTCVPLPTLLAAHLVTVQQRPHAI